MSVLICEYPFAEIARQNINLKGLSLKYNNHQHESNSISLYEVLQLDSNVLKIGIKYLVCFLLKCQTLKSYNMLNLPLVD